MGKKKVPGSGVAVISVKQFWCYYCDVRCEDEYKLIQHQRSKHFLCKLCDPNAYGRNCLSLSGLVSHTRRSHRKEIKEVPCAIEGRESLEVEVSAMNGIPDEAMAIFKKQLAEEMQEAMANQPEAAVAAAAVPEEEEEPQAPPEPAPPAYEEEEAPLPKRNKHVHTPVMPHFAELAQKLATQLSGEQTHFQQSKPPAVFGGASAEPAGNKQETVAFDPSMLAARLAAMEEENKRQEALQATAPSPPQRGRNRSPSGGYPSRKPEEAETATFEVQGKLGMACEPDTGIVAQVLEEGQARKLGVRAGWQIKTLDGQPFSAKLLQDCNTGGLPYKICFKKGKTVGRDEPKVDRGMRGFPRSRSGGRGAPRRVLSRSTKRESRPQRGSLKFRPRSMNRSQERAQRRDDLDDREAGGRQKAREEAPRDRGERGEREDEPPRRRRDRGEEGGGDDRGGGGDDRGGGGRGGDRGGDRDDRRGAGRGGDRGGDRDDRRGEEERPRRERRREDDRDDREAAPPEPEPEQKKRKSKWGPDEPTVEEIMGPGASMKAMMEAQPAGTKTEMCMAFTEGLCTKGDMCVYAHNLRELAPGGYKPRLCPSFMRGGCPRMGSCLFAHLKEELPPNFKCIMCRNYTSGFCRKQQICTLAHGEDEQQWFIKFMGVPEGGDKGKGKGGPGKIGPGSTPRVPAIMNSGPVTSAGMGGADDSEAMAMNVMQAAEQQLMAGKAMPGQLAIGMGGGMAPLKPAFQPKINMANNPALKAAAAAKAALALRAANTLSGGPNAGSMMGAPVKEACPYFAKGFCGFGDKCFKSHDAGGGSAPSGLMGSGSMMGPGMGASGSMMGGGITPAGGSFAKGGAPSPKPWAPPGGGMAKGGMEGQLAALNALKARAAAMGGPGVGNAALASATGKASSPMGMSPPLMSAPLMSPPDMSPPADTRSLCVRFEMGGCSLGAECPFSHVVKAP